MTVPFNDFPDMVAGVELDGGLTWDFKLPTGVTLTGTPTIAVSVYRHSAVNDPSPQTHLGSKTVGTADNGRTNCAVVAQFGPGLAGVRYLFTVSCARTDSPSIAACFNKILCVVPG